MHCIKQFQHGIAIREFVKKEIKLTSRRDLLKWIRLLAVEENVFLQYGGKIGKYEVVKKSL